jgi:hypothetical protein
LDKAFCPKYVVSPWLQSSTEPDRSTKSLCWSNIFICKFFKIIKIWKKNNLYVYVFNK